jgi:drug/metabolite transporter (DMT)-like permease
MVQAGSNRAVSIQSIVFVPGFTRLSHLQFRRSGINSLLLHMLTFQQGRTRAQLGEDFKLSDRTKLLAASMAISAAGLWGMTEVLSKYLLTQSSPMPIILIQLSSSFLVTCVVISIKYQYIELDRNMLLGWLLGVLHPGLSNSLGLVGLSHVGASVSSIIWSLEAITTMFAAWVLLDENISARQFFFSVLSLVGVFVASGSFAWDVVDANSLYGVIALLLAVLSCGIFGALSRQIVEAHGIDGLVLIVGQQATGLFWICLMLPLSHGGIHFYELANLPVGMWLACLVIGIVKFPVATGLFLASLRSLSAGHASSFLVLTPIFGIAAAMILLGETVSIFQCSGVAIVLVSVGAVQLFGEPS